MNEIIDSVQLGQCVLFINSKAASSDTIDVVEVQRISKTLSVDYVTVCVQSSIDYVMRGQFACVNDVKFSTSKRLTFPRTVTNIRKFCRTLYMYEYKAYDFLRNFTLRFCGISMVFS